ncbi:hypothetical protein NMY22_g8191 [Coprinellus aureogranulatus]|nr:hypothetical protein NMY22_g8191 [Coprinellus aureogranulatus]
MFSLRQFALGLIAAFLLPLVQAAALAPRHSSVPCTYTCPAKDDNGWYLAGGTQTPPGDYIKCSYQRYPYANTCFYNEDTGRGKRSNDKDCPETAKSSCDTRRREVRGIYQAYQEQRKRRAAQPTPTVPDYMKKRAALKKRDD